jgi:hypothetical protein
MASNGLISGTPTTVGTYPVTISATNVSGTGNATLTITSQVNPNVPQITSPSTAAGTTNTAFSYTIQASGTPQISFSATGLPSWLGLSGNVLSGTPTVAGNSTVNLTAQNTAGTSPVFPLSITIQAASGGTPTVNSPTTATATVGSIFIYQITASGNVTSYGATGLPPGLLVNSETGAITGMITSTAPSPVTVTISANNGGLSGSEFLVITLDSTSSNVPRAVLSQLGVSASALPDSGNAINLQVLKPQNP